MNELVPKLLAFPKNPPPAEPLKADEYDREIRIVKKLLDETPPEVLAANMDGGGTLLDVREGEREINLTPPLGLPAYTLLLTNARSSTSQYTPYNTAMCSCPSATFNRARPGTSYHFYNRMEHSGSYLSHS